MKSDRERKCFFYVGASEVAWRGRHDLPIPVRRLCQSQLTIHCLGSKRANGGWWAEILEDVSRFERRWMISPLSIWSISELVNVESTLPLLPCSRFLVSLKFARACWLKVLCGRREGAGGPNRPSILVWIYPPTCKDDIQMIFCCQTKERRWWVDGGFLERWLGCVLKPSSRPGDFLKQLWWE